MRKAVPRVLAIVCACLAAAAATAAAPPPAEAAIPAWLRVPTVTVAVGSSHTVVLRADGRLQAWGSNLDGQLGDGTTTQRLSPKLVGADTDWVAVACGANHTVALKANGALYAWGQNLDGQLGLNDTVSRSAPTRVGGDSDWVAVACGSFHTTALKVDGTLWVWGDNAYGQLGLDHTNDLKVPTKLGATTWSFVAAGGWHTLAIRAGGQLFAWGRNDYGQLGDGQGVEWHHPIRMGDATNWVALAGGAYHSAGLRADGSLYTWGRNNFGQLGLGNTTNVNAPARVGKDNDWVGVACGNLHTLGLKANATAYGWGYDHYGQLGDGGTTTQTSPVAVKSSLLIASLAAGGNHSAAVIGDGSVAAWGLNANGQVGDNTTTDRLVPTGVLASGYVWPAPRVQRGETGRSAAATMHSLAIKSNGTIWAWGDNGEGQIGDGTLDDRRSPVPVGPGGVWRSVATGYGTSYGLRHDGSLYSWGVNGNDQLGLGDGWGGQATSPVRIGSANNWVTITAGDMHALALRADGSLWAWGSNWFGQLGSGDTANKSVPTQVGLESDWVAVAASGSSSFALKADGRVYVCGDNYYGQLGTGDRTSHRTFTLLPGSTLWAGIGAGYTHTLGLTAQGMLYAWGSNAHGQLGRGDRVASYSPAQVSVPDRWVAITAGFGDFSHGVRVDGSAYGWGDNATGQVGDGTTTADILSPVYIGSATAVSSAHNHTLVTKARGDLYATGTDADGQLGKGTLGDVLAPTFIMRLCDLVAPSVTGLTSSSHPVQGSWYPDATADLQWTAADDNGLYGFSTTFGAAPAGTDLWLDLSAGATSVTSPALPDGIWYFSLQARDAGANWSTPAVRQIRVDTTAPSSAGTVTSPTHPDYGSWYRSKVATFIWGTATDATSGVAGYSWAVASDEPRPNNSVDGTGTSTTLAIGEGRWAFGVRAVDAAGNVGPITGKTVLVDTVDPVTSDDSDGAWHQAPVTVRLSGTDATSTVAATQYRIDGGPWQTANGDQAGDVALTFRTWKRGGNSGVHDLEYRSWDYAGNDEDVKSCQVKLDARPPTTWCDAPVVAMPAPVTVHLTPLDPDSGVAETRYTYDDRHWSVGTTIEFSGPGWYTLRYFSTDNVGNVEGMRAVTVKVAKFASPRVVPERGLRRR